MIFFTTKTQKHFQKIHKNHFLIHNLTKRTSSWQATCGWAPGGHKSASQYESSAFTVVMTTKANTAKTQINDKYSHF